MRTRAGGAATAALLAGLALTGCGVQDKVAEKVVEKAMESAAEEDGGGKVDVDIDADGEKMNIETDEGSMSFGGGEIPESFPDDLPLPDDYTVGMAMDVQGESAYIQLQLLTTEGTVEEYAASFEQQVRDAGYTIEGSTKQTVGGRQSVNLMAKGHGHKVMLGITPGATDEQISIVYNITADEG